MSSGAGVVAVKSAVDVIRPNVGDRHDVDVVGVERADQHVALVAGADDADAYGVFLVDRFVAEVQRAQAGTGGGNGA